ncbi:MAG TPA: TIGR02466 family protein [Gammaproteobacteria bacterium]|nr:TIGR02466 family protein [Gammaproteobacteria bacterium]
MSTSFYRPESSILADADLEELEEAVIGAAEAFLELTLKLPPRRLTIDRAWINIFEPGAQEAQHTHDGSLLSCSYYVEAPENCGCIVFPDPIGERRSYRQFTQTAGTDLLTRREIAVEPQPGRLVMFESWLAHAVQCNKSGKARISIAMNLRQVSEAAVAGPTVGDRLPASDRDAEERTGSTPAHRSENPAVRPFLFNELFDVPANLAVGLQAVADQIPAVVIDGFLTHAERARDVVGSAPAANWKHEQGGRNFVDYYDCRLRFPIRFPSGMISAAQQIIRKVYSADTRPADASVDVNWFMQINDKRGDFAVPHSDVTEKVRRSFTCIVYLNSRDECSGGTAFFRFRKSNSLIIDEAYARAIQERPQIAETGLDYWPERAETLWERVGAIDMVPGRLLIFPSEYFHAAYHPQNSFYEFPRLTLAYWMVC